MKSSGSATASQRGDVGAGNVGAGAKDPINAMGSSRHLNHRFTSAQQQQTPRIVNATTSSTILSLPESPLTELLLDLRRKHAAAAGPQAGITCATGLMGYTGSNAILTAIDGVRCDRGYKRPVHHHPSHVNSQSHDNDWQNIGGEIRGAADVFLYEFTLSNAGGNVDVEDFARTLEDDEDIYGFNIMHSHRGKAIDEDFNSRKSSNMYDADGSETQTKSQRRSPLDESKSEDSWSENKDIERNDAIQGDSISTSKRQHTNSIHHTNLHSRHPFSTHSLSHAQTLLKYTPHLRHLTPASAEMQGGPINYYGRSGLGHSNPFSQLASMFSSLPSSSKSLTNTATISDSSSVHGGSESHRLNRTNHGEFITIKTGKSYSSHHSATDISSGSNYYHLLNNSTMTMDWGTACARARADACVASELAAFVGVLAHEMSLEEFASIENGILKSIFNLMHSNERVKQLGGVAALDALIGIASSDEEKKSIKFANNLSNGLRAQKVDYEFLAAVTRALGRMARGATNIDMIECEVTRALEWLQTERSERRLAAVLTLKELAKNAPTVFYSKINVYSSGTQGLGSNEFIEHIFPVLRDPQPMVRVCAADALAECLKIIVERKHRSTPNSSDGDGKNYQSTTGILCMVHHNVMEGFHMALCHNKKRNLKGKGIEKDLGYARSSYRNEPVNPKVLRGLNQAQVEAAQHASLLVVGDMLKHTRDFMLPRFDEVCCAVMNLRSHPRQLLRLEVVRLIPRLAARCPGAFARQYLEDGLTYILECASATPSQRSSGSIDMRPAAFLALGQLVLAMSTGKEVGGGSGVPKTCLKIRRCEEYYLEKTEGDNYKKNSGHEKHGNNNLKPIPYRIKTGDIYANLDNMFSLVRSGMHKSMPRNTRSEALHCGAALVQALGNYADMYISDLLKDTFQSGLSEDLILCLRSISTCVPSETDFIENRLLQEFCFCLAGTTEIQEICNPLSIWNPSHSYEIISPPQITINMSERADVIQNLVLSLRTLGTFGNKKGEFNFYGSPGTLLPFVRDVVVQYLSHPSACVRREAALTSCLLLFSPKDNVVQEDLFDNFVEDNNRTNDDKFGVNSIAYMTSVNTMLPPSYLCGGRLGSSSGILLEEVLQKLLRVAVSDPSPLVRHCVVRSLHGRYDPFICQSHHLPPLFLLLQDEVLAVRAAALRLLGRLARLNPAAILPDLRRVLMELIIELRCGGDTGGGREAATRLLVVFLRADALHRLVHPFLHSILEALPLKGVAPRLASAALEALGELAKVTRTNLIPWLHQLIPHILETMQDQSSASKQRTSLRTLGLIVGNTGYVVGPYLDYPQLLPQAVDVLPGTKRAPWALRREVIRTLGILGALDPDRYHDVAINTRKGGGVGSGYFIEVEGEHNINSIKRRHFESSNHMSLDSSNPLDTSVVISSSNSGSKSGSSFFRSFDGLPIGNEHLISTAPSSKKRSEKGENEPAHLYMYGQYAMTAQPVSKLPPARRLTPSDDEFYPTVAIQALTRILKDPSLAVHHGMVMQAVMYIFNNLGLRGVPFLKRIVPHILHTVRTCGQPSLREALLQQVASLSGIVKDHLRPYVPAIFDVVEEFWTSSHLATILKLVEEMASGVPDDFRRYVPGLVKRLLSSIEGLQLSDWSDSGIVVNTNRHYTADLKRLELILRSIRRLRGTLGEYMHLLVPILLKLTDSLINPSLGAHSSMYLPSTILSKLTITTIQTISVLLQAKESGILGVGSKKWSGIGVTTQHSSSSLPARAAQPLMRMLGKDANAGKDVGMAIVEALCVCAKQLGRGRWMPLYHLAARDAIMDWQDRVGLLMSPSPSESETGQLSQHSRIDGCRQILAGVNLYDKVVEDFICENTSSATARSYNEDAMLCSSYIGDIQNRSLGGELDSCVLDGTSDPLESENQNATSSIQPIPNQANKHRVNEANLQRAWDVSQRATREDWDEWMRRFAVQLLREAPAPALRATAGLAHAYQPLARELFSAAFVCCWSELQDAYRSKLIEALKNAFSADISPEILQTLLNLAEFMEHDGVEGGLPIEINVLANLALKCRSYAKALHYKEREHSLGGCGSECIEDLININKKLDLPEAALGVLKAAQIEVERRGIQSWENSHTYSIKGSMGHGFSSIIFNRHQGVDLAYSVMSTSDEIAARGGGVWAGVTMQESWLAKLGSWADALAMYERRLETSPYDFVAILGCMKCLNARGEWHKVLELARKTWNAFVSDYASSWENRKALRFCAQAAWRLGQWDDLEKYSSQLLNSCDNNQGNNLVETGVHNVDFDGAFFSAVLNINREEWNLAAYYIDAARKAMDSRFTALMAESYKRAIPSMVTAQTLSEMEEIIEFRKLEGRAKTGAHRHPANRDDEIEARKRLISVWRKRLAGCRFDAEVHSTILAVRSLVLGPTDEVDATLALSTLSRQDHSFKLAERVLLDPLAELGADINGSVFGFGVPESLKLGLFQTRYGSWASGSPEIGIDRLITGDGSLFYPQYGALHKQYFEQLETQAGGIERLKIQHRLYYAYVKHLWAMDHGDEAIHRLTRLADIVDMICYHQGNNKDSLRVSCWLKVGEWKAKSNPPGTPLSEWVQNEVLIAYKRATAANGSGYKAWHAWALANFRFAQQSNESRYNVHNDSNLSSGSVWLQKSANSSKLLKNHVIAAVQGFVKAICLGTKRWSASVQQDLLNFLTCLFRYGEIPDIGSAIKSELGAVTLEVWLGVLPQLLARIHIKSPSIRSVLHSLLIRLGEKHPQALMYPLSVLLKGPVTERKEAAESLMTSLKKHSYALVEEALMVSSELIRVAILWLELWHEGLEDASRQYFGEGNVSGMLDVLRPLHEQLERGPSTKREEDFHKNFGRDLAEAHAFIKEYVRLTTINGGEIPTKGGFMPGLPTNGLEQAELSLRQNNVQAEAALNQAWNLYYTVFRRINKQLPGLTTLELSQCSPALLKANSLELGVPGSYRVDGSYVKIERFIPSVQVITSKQRPRKIVLRGGDGKDYVFLLKGHEDLRQDERVMQLFGLVNALLARDYRTKNHDLNIQRYAIAPLSHNAGIVGWVPHCDTFHSLIRDYRETKKNPFNMEFQQMLKLAPDYQYDMLTVMQKIEIFSEALDRTTGKGNDLYEVLWIKSMNSEEWLERRTKFTRSLAVMSMVGYILGLGDRHPSNLMLDQVSGRVLHIDFGDCFEVAMHREKFPEKIPFRLTRMLTKAMEVSGIEGNYRSTCERTMTVLRDNRDSLVAMLEAFVYDPLISWRLLEQTSNESNIIQPQSVAGEGVHQISKSKQVLENMSKGEADGAKTFTSSQAMMHQPIRESKHEDSMDDDDRSVRDIEIFARPTSLQEQIHRASLRSEEERKTNASNMQSSHTRSLQMYSNIQNMAANMSSSRIASITGDASEQLAVEGSLARSRLDRSVRQREAMSYLGGEADLENEEALNEKALKVIRRVQDKLTGTDFHAVDEACDPLGVQEQVQKLIVEATSTENLCQLFIGWCAFW